MFKEKSDEAFKTVAHDYLKKYKMEIPDETSLFAAFQQAKLKKEQHLFNQIDGTLSLENKQYIDNILFVDNADHSLVQFLRQDSGASTKDSIKEEIKHLQTLNELPITSLGFIRDIHTKKINVYRRRFLSDTPARSKQRTELSRYALVTIFCYHRHIAAIDNLVDHLIHFIHQIKKTEYRK